jgi:riboflavin synthase
MFTGIVDDIGRVAAVERPGDTRFCIETAYDTATIVAGASIACSGACLTVVDTGPGWFAVEASAETLSRTTLGGWRVGTPVNLECPLRVNRLVRDLVRGTQYWFGDSDRGRDPG